jgi:hypothetical protein
MMDEPRLAAELARALETGQRVDAAREREVIVAFRIVHVLALRDGRAVAGVARHHVVILDEPIVDVLEAVAAIDLSDGGDAGARLLARAVAVANTRML